MIGLLIFLFVLTVLSGAAWAAFEIRNLRTGLDATKNRRDEWRADYSRTRDDLLNVREKLAESEYSVKARNETIDGLNSQLAYSADCVLALQAEIRQLKRFAEMSTVSADQESAVKKLRFELQDAQICLASSRNEVSRLKYIINEPKVKKAKRKTAIKKK